MKNILEYKGYCGTIEFSEPDNVFFGKIIGIRSLILYEGNNEKELKEDFEGAVDDYLESCKEDGFEPEKPYIGNFNVQLSPELHKTLALYSVSRGKSINSTVEEAIRYYIG